MNLIAITVATLVAGIGSVWIAALLLRLGVQRDDSAHGAQYLLSLAAGALLATAFMHLLPEAFESGLEPATLFATLLLGLVVFFLLDKAELWHHGHEHHQPAQEHRAENREAYARRPEADPLAAQRLQSRTLQAQSRPQLQQDRRQHGFFRRDRDRQHLQQTDRDHPASDAAFQFRDGLKCDAERFFRAEEIDRVAQPSNGGAAVGERSEDISALACG